MFPRFPAWSRAILTASAVLLTGLLAPPASGQSAPETFGITTLTPPRLNVNPGPMYWPRMRIWQGIPGIERAPGGRLWATWYTGGIGEGKGHNHQILVTSGDDGHTWSKPVAVFDPGRQLLSGEGGDPHLWLDPNGRLWWFVHRLMPSPGIHPRTCWGFYTETPDQARPVWLGPVFAGYGYSLNKEVVLADGTWLHMIDPFSKDPAPPSPLARKGAHVYRFTGYDRPFEPVGHVEIQDTPFTEHMVVQRKDGRLWMLARATYGLAQAESHDGGRTWRELGPFTKDFNVNSRFHFRKLASGGLLLVVNDHPKSRQNLTAMLSEDDGLTWPHKLVLDPRPSVSYPDATQAPDGTIYATYDRGRYQHDAQEILMAKFTEADVKAGRLVSTGSRLQQTINKLADEGGGVRFTGETTGMTKEFERLKAGDVTTAVTPLPGPKAEPPPGPLSDGMQVLPWWKAGMPRAGVPGAGFSLLTAAKHAPVFQPTREEGAYNHHSELIWHRGKFHAMWSNHPLIEDGPGQRVLFSASETPERWPAWRELFPAPGPVAGSTPDSQPRGSFASAMTWMVRGERLYAVAAVNTAGPLAREVGADGALGPIFRLWQRDATLPFLALAPDDPAVAAPAAALAALIGTPDCFPWWDFWGVHPAPAALNGRKLMEPTVHQARDGSHVMLLRDSDRRGYTHRVFASVSTDGGKTWPPAWPTDIPDTPSRRDVVRLADGTILMVGNQAAPEFDGMEPRHYPRDPLTVAVSRDGYVFDRAYALRWNLPKEFRIPGVKGRGFGAQYPSVIVQADTLYVLHTVGKEDVAIAWVPLRDLAL